MTQGRPSRSSPGLMPTKRRPQTLLGVTQTRAVQEGIRRGGAKKWGLNHPRYTDFLEASAISKHSVGHPSYSFAGWQRPCYLMAGRLCQDYKELLETTEWRSSVAARTRAATTAWRLRLRADTRVMATDVRCRSTAGAESVSVANPATVRAVRKVRI